MGKRLKSCRKRQKKVEKARTEEVNMIILSKNGYTVHQTNSRRCACYIIETDKNCVLIDTSMGFEKEIVAKSLKDVLPKKINAVFLTHSHSDHVANAKYFSELFNCKVYISNKGLTKLQQGHCAMPHGTNSISRMIRGAESIIPFYQFTQFSACPQAEQLNNEVVKFYLGESAELIETPGHSDDSVSILLDDCIAFVGDAMVNNFGMLYPPFADDEKALIDSWKLLLNTQCDLFCPAHGKPVSREKFVKVYRNIKKKLLL